MSNRKKMRGSIFRGGHQALTRGILKDSEVTVISKGSDFMNVNDFPTIYWMMEFIDYCKRNDPQTISKRNVDEIWRSAKSKIKRLNKIIIAETPEWVTRKYVTRLDGGILHEAFHSLYTERGTSLDTRKIANIMDKHFDPDINYGVRGQTLKILNNIFEDAFIERQGIEKFRGAKRRIQSVHEMVWERERYSRNYRPPSSPMVDENGNPLKDDKGEPLVHPQSGQPLMSMSPLSHLTCYLRDRVEFYLNNQPFDEYHEEVVRVADEMFDEVIEDSNKTTSSYDAFELAMRSIAIVADLFDLVEQHQQQQQQGQQGQQSKSGQSGESGQGGQGQKSQQGSGNRSQQPSAGGGGSGQNEEGEGEEESENRENGGSESEEETEEEEQGQGQGHGGEGGEEENEQEGNESSCEDGESEEEEKEGEGDGGDEDENEDGEESEEGKGADPQGASNNGPDRGDGAENVKKEAGEANDDEDVEEEESDDLSDVDRDLLKQMADEGADTNGMEDISSALKQEWDDQVSIDAPPSVLPFSREVDDIIILEAEGTEEEARMYNEIADKVKSDTLYIRPRMLSFFRGQKKNRMRHRRPKGRRLSSRSVSEVVYKNRPRPFVTKEKTNRKNSCVSLVIDESGSMRSRRNMARRILATLALTIGNLKIPLEITGFTTNHKDSLRDYLHENPSQDTREYRNHVRNTFSRTVGCRYRVFRTFDEPFNIKSWRKLVQTEASNLTPLPDALEFAAKRIVPRQEEQKIIFVVTDGYPCYHHWSQEDYLNIMNRQVEDLKHDDVEVLWIGVGGGADFVQRYDNSLSISSMDNFSHKMTQFMFEQMKRLLTNK